MGALVAISIVLFIGLMVAINLNVEKGSETTQLIIEKNREINQITEKANKEINQLKKI